MQKRLKTLILFLVISICPGQTPQELYTQTMLKFENSDFSGAMAGFQKLLEETGKSEFHYYLAYCHLKLGDYSQARRHFSVLIDSGDKGWESRLGLARALFHLGELDESRSLFEQVVARNQHLEARYHLGLIAQEQEDDKKAIEHFLKVIEEAPFHRGALFNLGHSNLRLKREKRAEMWLQRHQDAAQKWDRLEKARKGAALPTATPPNWLSLAQAHLELHQWEQALQASRQARQLAPDWPAADYVEAYALYRSGRMEESIQSYQRFLQRDPDNNQAHFDLGHAYRKAGRFSEAVQSFTRAAALDSSDPLPPLAMLEMEVEAGDLQAALATARQLVDAHPAFAHGFYMLALIQFRLERPREALATVAKAIELDEQKGDYHLLAGNILLQLGRTQEAREAFARAGHN